MMEPANWHKLVRNLVLEGHMPYRDVLELTPWQVMLLLTEESDTPGRLTAETIEEHRRICGA